MFENVKLAWKVLTTKKEKEEMDLHKLVQEYYGDPAIVDRVGDWDRFAKEMHDYIGKFTVAKYGGEDKPTFDLMVITEPRESLWNIIKYGLRMWNGKGKKFDWYKIAHYCQMGWTKANSTGTTDWKSLGIEQDVTKTG
jgi:hypothetical protein